MSNVALIPINAGVLRWAIEEARSSTDALDEKLRLEHDTVASWARGDREPNTAQVRMLAKTLGRSVQFFLLSEPPQSLPVEARFRRSLDENSQAPEKEAIAHRSALRAQKLAAWAEDRSQLQARILSATPNETPEHYADRLKLHLQWRLQLQTSATSKAAVFRNLRSRVEDLGVIVLLQSAGENGFRGLSLQSAPPVIFLNKDYQGAALRSFTLLHELAHIGAGTGDRSCYYEDTVEERWCNQVATEFLLPRERFLEYVRSKGVTRATPEDMDIVRLASNYFKASWLAVAIRLKELGVADQSLPNHVRENYTLEKDPSSPVTGVDRSTPVIRAEEFGSSYIRILQGAVRNEQLSELEAGKLLRADSKQLQRIWQLVSEAG